MTFSVTLADRKELNARNAAEGDEEPEERAPKEDGASLDLMSAYGFKAEALTAGTRALYQVEDDRQGVVVTKVDPRSGAAERQLRPGLVILKVGTTQIKGMADFNAAVKKAAGKPLLLYVAPPNGEGRSTLAIPPR